MTALPLTVTLLSVIALAQCGTLRQYGRDWLIPQPEPQVDSKRITAKSVFIAPAFSAENVRCASGFTRDSGGRCVKLVQVNQAAQLDFLLQRLNAMYGAPVLSHAENQPLQVTVEIPVEPAVYSHVVQPEGGVSIDLLPSDAGHADASGVPQGSSVGPQVHSGQTDLPETENEPDVMVVPSKELFQVDEEPIVTLTDIETEEDEASTSNTTPDSEQSTNFDELFSDEEVPDKPVSIDTEDAGLMAAVSKNESNIVKKQALPGKHSTQTMHDSKIKTESVPVISTNETQSDLPSDDKTAQNVKLANKNKHVSKPSTLSDDASKKPLKGDGLVYNKTENEDDLVNEVHTETSGLTNGTSSKLGELPAASEHTSMLTSSEESTDVWTAHETESQVSSSTVEGEYETTLKTKFSAETTGLSTLATPEDSSESTEQTSTITVTDDGDFDSEYPVREADLEVGYEDLGAEGGDVGVGGSEVSTESGSVTSRPHRVNDSAVTIISVGELDSASGDGDVSELEYSGDSEDFHVSVNKSVSLNSTNTSDKTDSDNSFNFPLINGMKLDEILGFPEAIDSGVVIPSGTLLHKDGGYMSHLTSNVDRLSGEVLKTESSVHNANIESHDATEEVKPVQTSQHSVHVVYPQPIIEVLNVKQDSHGHRTDTANTNETKTELEETTDLNSPPDRYHNLSPNPVEHYNSHPVPQVERFPEPPPPYSGHPHPYPPQHRPHPYPPQHQTHHRPYHHPPRRPHPGGFVRFPAEPPHHHPHRHGDAGNAVRFPQEDSRTNDKYSRWGNWRPEEGPDEGHWGDAENRRHYRVNSRPTRRRPQLVYY